ncbi:MAG: L-2-hydroxyglutarate oxidase, partial [Planctomycetota bacterium]|nr:L-2-hydroxyglutarate oxidase [Planctomycetota bacterium]
VAVLEKEPEVGLHQSGRNSNVLHSGLYYKPGSYKAKLCRKGALAMKEFCQGENLPYLECGKVVVATKASELSRLHDLHERALTNGVNCRLIEKAELKEIEPQATGLKALHVPEAAVVDYKEVCNELARQLQSQGAQIFLGTAVKDIQSEPDSIVFDTEIGPIKAKQGINCAGLYSDKIAAMCGLKPKARVIPFRGEYFALSSKAEGMIRGMIYPTPNPRFPFLGVHFTPTAMGGAECGPNAVPALAREGYRWRDIHLRECAHILSWPGTWALLARYGPTALAEVARSLSKSAFTKALQKLVPAIQKGDLLLHPSGVRAQTVLRNGTLVDDFMWMRSNRMLHVLNAPSPAATASLAIGRFVSQKGCST